MVYVHVKNMHTQEYRYWLALLSFRLSSVPVDVLKYSYVTYTWNRRKIAHFKTKLNVYFFFCFWLRNAFVNETELNGKNNNKTHTQTHT